MITIVNPENSFVRFDETVTEHCLWPGLQNICLPVYDQEDIYFQFVLQAETAEEANTLCGLTNEIQVGLVEDCLDDDFLLEFSEKPDRFRISPTQVLYNWMHGVPSFIGSIDIGECFKIRIKNGDDEYCSNCFQRISDNCFTSLIEYSNDENGFGFLYCADAEGLTGNADDDGCDGTAIDFINKSTLTIPYTSEMLTKYGPRPSVQVWMYIDGVLQQAIVQITLDGLPPTQIYIDNGGPATGYVIIK